MPEVLNITLVYLTIKVILHNLKEKKKESVKMDYTLKNFDANLWKKFKAKCALEGITIKDKILQMIKAYVEK